jgi:hypothetical protein
MTTNRITLIAGSGWFWGSIAALEALLIVGIVAIVLASRAPIGVAPAPAAAPAASVSGPAVVAEKRLIACKPCQDEVLADQERQSGARAFAAHPPSARDRRRGQEGGLLGKFVSAPARPTARMRLIACKPCQDEVLADRERLANPAALIGYTSGGSFEEQQTLRRGTSPR